MPVGSDVNIAVCRNQERTCVVMLKQSNCVSPGNHDNFRQRVGDHAVGRAHRSAIDAASWPTGGGIDDRRCRRFRRLKQIEATRRGRQRFIDDLDTADRPARITRIANMNHLRVLSEHSKIATCVDYASWHFEATQHLQRTIDRKTFRNSSEINPDAGMSKADSLL